MPTQLNAQQLNSLASQLVRAQAVEMKQQIFSQLFNPASQTVVNVMPRNVGLIKGFIVEVIATMTNTGTVPIYPTDFNVANLLSQISFTDLNNNTRIQTTGWHLELMNTVKSRKPYGSALVHTTGIDAPVNYGSNWAVCSLGSGATSLAAISGSSGDYCTLKQRYYVPLAYSDNDLRGAVYANVINSTMNLTLNINPNPVVAGTTADTLNAVFKGATGAAGTLTNVQINVYQIYLDQLPRNSQNGAPVLPIMDLSTIYELKNTAFSNLSSGTDFPIQFPNFRDFLSTVLVFSPDGYTRNVGSDLNYLALQSANFTNIWKLPPEMVALLTRQIIGCDMPPGVYYISNRQKPISTVQYGNMEIIVNPTGTVGAGAYAQVGWEDFALVNTLTQAGSLPAA
jgi:hypothetical protein